MKYIVNNKHVKLRQGGILKAQGGLGKVPILGPVLKRLAYKIITNPDVGYQGGATNKNIKDAIFNKSESLKDDNKEYFLFGVDRQETSLGKAYDWSKDIKENKYKNVKSYQGVLNPYNEYLIDKQNEDMVRKLADAKYSFGSNINYEYQDPKTDRIVEGTPYFDDVHGYRGTFHYDKNGNPVISSSDLYDFGKNYTKGFLNFFKERNGNNHWWMPLLLETERRALNAVGQPYILIQKDIPIRFVENPKGEELNRVNNFEEQVLSPSFAYKESQP